jgi:hypothetical protein
MENVADQEDILHDSQKTRLVKCTPYHKSTFYNGVYNLKHNPTTTIYCGTKIKSEAGPPLCNMLSQSPP